MFQFLKHIFIQQRPANSQAQTSLLGLLVTPKTQSTCCYALQEKVWLKDPDGADWEVYAVLEDSVTC